MKNYHDTRSKKKSGQPEREDGDLIVKLRNPLIYFAVVGVLIASSSLIAEVFGINLVRSLLFCGGLFYLSAAIGFPKIMFELVRGTGLFSYIKGWWAIRLTLLIIAISLLAASQSDVLTENLYKTGD